MRKSTPISDQDESPIAGQVDLRFSLVAGSYLAALVAPTVVFVAVNRLQLRDTRLVVALLGLATIGTTAVVVWQVTRSGAVIVWLGDGHLRWLVPFVGLVPVVGYVFPMIEFFGHIATGIEAETATALVGFTGFVLGVVASCLGDILVHMARNRLADAAVNDNDVILKWTAGWTRADRIKAIAGGTILGAIFFVAILLYLGWLEVLFEPMAILQLFFLFIVLALVTNTMSAKRTYRVTPAGLERRLQKPRGTRLFTPWSAFDGLTVTDTRVLLHRGPLQPDVRFSRRDLVDEDAVIAALDDHLER